MGIVFLPCADSRDATIWDWHTGGFLATSGSARTGTYYYGTGGGYKNVPARADYYLRTSFKLTGALSDIFIYMQEGNTKHVYIDRDIDGFYVKHGLTNAVLGQYLFPTVTNAWYTIEAYVKIGNADGRVIVKLEGTQIIDTGAGGVDTQNGGTGVIDRVYYAASVTTVDGFDDICVRDDKWPGLGGNYLLTVTGDGDDTGWTASAGAAYQCVDEVPPVATDYVAADSTAAGTRCLFQMSDLAFDPVSINGVAVWTKQKLAVAGSGTSKAISKNGAVYTDGDDQVLDTSELWLESLEYDRSSFQ